MKKQTIFILFLLLSCSSFLYGARVDTLDIPSAIMNKKYKAAVVLPASYGNNDKSYPVLYLLHGGFEHFDAWLSKTPNQMLLHNLADNLNIIIVMPEGESFSFYLDSPINKESQFETYITKEVVSEIDNTYRTVKDRKGRVISGASMGGFGAIYLATRNPNLFCAAGSMSGAMDLNMTHYKISSDDVKSLKLQLEKILGPEEKDTANFYFNHSPINMLLKIKNSNVKLIIDCGVDDILIETNREFNRRLMYHKIPHDYIERPGTHTWEYFGNSLPHQVQYFYNVFKENGIAIL